MRVAYISVSRQISGAERSLQTMLRSVVGAGVSPLLVCPAGDGMIGWARENGIPFETATLNHRDARHPIRWWMSVRRLRSILQDQRIEVVHCNHIYCYPAAAVAARGTGAVRICHIRNELGPGDLAWWCAAGAEGVLCISRHIETQVAATWPVGRRRPVIRTVLNSVALPPLGSQQEQSEARHHARRLCGVDAHGPEIVLGYIGQLIPLKGVVELLEALAGLPQGASWTLLVAGGDPAEGAPYEKRCRERVHELGLEDRVKFLGYLADPSVFYQAIDLAVVPSLEEPLGRIPLEAASYGRPSVAFAAGGLPETINHGQTGWLVPVGDVAALGRTIRQFLDAPSVEFGREARAFVESVAHPDRYAEAITRFYGELAVKA